MRHQNPNSERATKHLVVKPSTYSKMVARSKTNETADDFINRLMRTLDSLSHKKYNEGHDGEKDQENYRNPYKGYL